MVEFFYSLAPPGFEPGTFHTLAERATGEDEKILGKKCFGNKLHTIKSVKKRGFLPEIFDFVATSVDGLATV